MKYVAAAVFYIAALVTAFVGVVRIFGLPMMEARQLNPLQGSFQLLLAVGLVVFALRIAK